MIYHLPYDIYSMVLAYTIDSAETIEKLLVVLPDDTAKCLASAMHHAFSAKYLSKLELINYLTALWGDHYFRICAKGLKYLIPWSLKKFNDIDRTKAVNDGAMIAADHGKIAILNLMVNEYALNVDYGCGALLYGAALNGHYDTVKFLLSVGAKSSLRGHAVILAAAGAGRQEVVRLLVPEISKNKARVLSQCLVRAAMHGHSETIRLLITLGANLESNAGKMMISACHRNQADVIDCLISLGVDATIADVLIHAVLDNHVEVVRVLLRRGNRQYLYSPEYIITSVVRNYHQIVRLFMNPDLDINGKELWPALSARVLENDEIRNAIDHARTAHLMPI